MAPAPRSAWHRGRHRWNHPMRQKGRNHPYSRHYHRFPHTVNAPGSSHRRHVYDISQRASEK